jgi:DNA-binding NtrC family response regulator
MRRTKQRDRELAANSSAFQMPSHELHSVEPVARSIHLLDRDSDCLLFLFEYLSTAGFDVSASSGVENALKMVERCYPTVLIAEMDAPEMSGLDLVEKVRAISPGTRIILTTERLDRGLGNQVLCLGDEDLIVKPLNWTVLMRAVERALKDVAREAAMAAPPPVWRKEG